MLLVVLLCGGCQRTADDILADYPLRVGRIVEADNSAERALPPAQLLPDPRQLQLPLHDITIDLTAAWPLRQCGLMNRVGERNSILGKVQRPSVQLRYEVRVLTTLKQCRRQRIWHQLTSTRQQLFQKIIEQKQQQWPQRWANFLVTAPALRSLFSPTRQALPAPLPTGVVAELEQALNYLQALAALPDNAQALSSLESQLQVLQEDGRFISQLHYTVLIANRALSQARQLLMTYGRHIPCVQGHASAQARRAETFLYNYYNKQVQPYLSALQTAINRLLPALDQLYLHHLNPLMRQHYQQWRQPLLTLSTEARAHAQAWQQLLGRCGLMPGR